MDQLEDIIKYVRTFQKINDFIERSKIKYKRYERVKEWDLWSSLSLE